MKPRLHILLLLAALALPAAAQAQGIAIGGRAGTLGFGGEAALGLNDNFVLRGGVGSFFLDFKGDLDDVEYTVTPPSMTATVGIDLYPTGGSFRIMGGFMYRDGDFSADSEDIAAAGGVEIGDVEYTEAGTLHGTLATKSTAPFVGIGFGNHTRGGFGFFLDLGVAFVGEPDVVLEARGPLASASDLQTQLAIEEQNIEDDAGEYLKYWPIVNLGIKIPIG